MYSNFQSKKNLIIAIQQLHGNEKEQMGEQSARYYDMEKHEHNKHENKEKRATSDPAQILTGRDHDVLRLHLPKLSQLNGMLDLGADEYTA